MVVRGRAIPSDGDTLRVFGHARPIRLAGSDAPEATQQCWLANGSPWQCGAWARATLAELLSTGPVECRVLGRDRFDRDLATCSVGPLDLDSAMIERGAALAYRGPVPADRRAAQGRYRALEAGAAVARRGLHQGRFDHPQDYRRQDSGRRGAA